MRVLHTTSYLNHFFESESPPTNGPRDVRLWYLFVYFSVIVLSIIHQLVTIQLIVQTVHTHMRIGSVIINIAAEFNYVNFGNMNHEKVTRQPQRERTQLRLDRIALPVSSSL